MIKIMKIPEHVNENKHLVYTIKFDLYKTKGQDRTMDTEITIKSPEFDIEAEDLMQKLKQFVIDMDTNQ